MSISDGDLANAATFNSSFMSREVDTDTTGVVGLLHPSSGGLLNNIQQDINDIFSVVGMAGENDASATDYSSEEVVTDGDSRKVAIEKLDAKFSATGHAHTGVSGDGAPVSALNLANINLYEAHMRTTTFSGASGTSNDVSASFSGETSGGGDTTEGVITDAPNNLVEIRVLSNGEQIEDAGGQKVYGRITESGGTWTLTYYTNEAGVETAHSLGSYDLRLYYNRVFTIETRPTLSSNAFNIGSLDYTADVVDATATQRGLMSTSTQTFAGAKTWNAAQQFELEQIMKEIATPSNPSAGYMKLYFKTDEELYKLNPSGTETQISGTTGGGGGGGGGSIQWSEGTGAPIATTNLGFDVYEWAPGTAQGLLGNCKVPQSYVTGTQIFLYINFFANGTSNNVLFSTINYLVTSADAVDDTTNSYTSTNSAQTLASPANRYFQVILDLTDASGEINGVPVAPGDNLFFTLYRDGGDTFTGNAYTLRPMPTEVTFS